MNETKLNLKKYEQQVIRSSRSPIMSVHPGGIRFNTACLKYLVGKDSCNLYADEAQKVVVIKPMGPGDPGSVKINYGGRNARFASIACKPFINQFKISVCLGFFRSNVEKKSVQVKATWDAKEKWFVLDLKPYSKY